MNKKDFETFYDLCMAHISCVMVGCGCGSVGRERRNGVFQIEVIKLEGAVQEERYVDLEGDISFCIFGEVKFRFVRFGCLWFIFLQTGDVFFLDCIR